MTVYGRFAQAFNYPNEQMVSDLISGSYCDDLAQAFADCDAHPLAGALETLQKHSVEAPDPAALLLDLEKDYTRMCFASKPRLVYLFESVYREGKLLQDSTFRIARLYDEAGLKVSNGFDLPPDHISLELEFMAYLHHCEAAAIETGHRDHEEQARALERRTLEEHLHGFGLSFAQRMEAHARMDFYRISARLLAGFLGTAA